MPHRRPTTGNEDSRVFEGGRRSLCGADDSVGLMADADGDDVRLAVPVRTYGLSAVCGTIISLSGAGIGEDILCYAAAEHLILHDLSSGEQRFLSPSHRGAVTHLVASADSTVLASTEAGPQGQVFVWHTASRRRFATVSSLQGIAGLLLSPDGRYLAVLSCCAESGQDLSVWQLEDLAQSPDATPLCTGEMVAPGTSCHAHICAQWDAASGCTIMSTGSHSVGFWDNAGGGASCPPLVVSPNAVSLGQPVTLTVSAFVPDRQDQAITGTLTGNVVLWQGGHGAGREWQALKQVPLHTAPIRFMAALQGLIYCGFSDGRARAYDSRLRLASWAETPKGAAAVSVAVPAAGQSSSEASASYLPDVIVSLASGLCLRLPQVGFGAGSEPHRSEAGARQVQILVQHPRGIVAMAAHPRLPLVAMASRRSIALWDCVRHERLCGLDVGAGTDITTLCFGHRNNWLAVGTASGNIMMLTADTLDHRYDLKQVKKSIAMMASDAASQFLVAATVSHVILLFSWQPVKQRFSFAGSCKAASAPVAICFGEDPAGRTQLLSIAADHTISEFDIDFRHLQPELRTNRRAQLCSEAGISPLALTFAPPQPYYDRDCTEAVVVIASDDGLLRVFSTVTWTCVATCRDPQNGMRIVQLTSYRAHGIRDHGHIAFCTSNGQLGFMNWPLTGDPADCLIEQTLPLDNADALPAKAIPMVFCATARSVMINGECLKALTASTYEGNSAVYETIDAAQT